MTTELWKWLATCPTGAMLRVHPSMMAEMEELGFHVHTQTAVKVEGASLHQLIDVGVPVRTFGGRSIEMSTEVGYNTIEMCTSLAVPVIVIELKRGV